MYLKNLKEKEGESEMQSNIKLTKYKDNCAKQKGITLIALVVTIIIHCDKTIKYSNNNGFLLSRI